MNSTTRLTATGLAVIITAFLGACAHHDVKPADISATANPTEEVRSLAAEVDAGKGQQLDVLAPDNFEKAQKNSKQAQERLEKGKKNDKILESVAYGRAYLNRAQEMAKRSQEELADVTKARQLAIHGGAHTYSRDLAAADKKLMKYTERIENGDKINRKNVTDLQAEYLDLELKAMKGIKLGEARNALDSAEKLGAKRLTPESYNAAKEKLAYAEKALETDRHNDAVVNKATEEASQSAKRALSMVETARQARNQSPEEIAKAIQARDADLATTGAQLSAAQLEAQNRQRALSEQEARAGQMRSQNQQLQSELEKREAMQKAFETAQSTFKKDEAEVYRQGDNLVVRLKSINFPSGRAELPGTSINVLGKVKDVIREMKAQEVVVEGHTDSTGSPEANKKVSEQRAEAVAQYFTADNSMEELNRVEAVGVGFEKPIASNKTKAGRAQNRRVDIVIKTASAADSNASSNDEQSATK